MASNKITKSPLSKIHENMLRIRVIYTLVRFGYASAKKVLGYCSQHLGHNLSLNEKQIEDNRYGVEKELDFYASFASKYSLIPTLDAGCQFDFVGRLRESVVAIDVCGGVKNKQDMPPTFGELGWRRYVVEVKCVNVHWHWIIDGKLCLADMPIDRIATSGCSAVVGGVVERFQCPEQFEFIRHYWLSRVAKKERLSLLLDELSSLIEIKQPEKDLLVAQMRFFKTYCVALNLVATLSFVGGIDFVGQHGIKVEYYHIIVDCDACREQEYKSLISLPCSVDAYKIVRYDKSEHHFSFMRVDDPAFYA